MKEKIAGLLEATLAACIKDGSLPPADLPFVEIMETKDEAHGDYATNLALILASRVRRSPRQVAEALVANLVDTEGVLGKVDIAGPGFINFFVRDAVWLSLLHAVAAAGKDYGRSDLGRGRRVQVEFVSANPTGPLHIGHARGAVVGDVMANILAATGHAVSREYYINDAGNQMNNLGKSVWFRYRELLGDGGDFPEGGYRGEYIWEQAREILRTDGDRHRNVSPDEAVPLFTEQAGAAIMDGIRQDLADFGVAFDTFFSERDLYRDRGVFRLLELLEDRGFLYREDDSLWFRTTAFGDEKDRVVVRRNGEPTYFAADIAYHHNKFLRGFETLIDIWGADHHGYIPRVQAGIQALGHPRGALKVILVQLVNLLRDGRPVAMSTRAGEFVTLREVMDEVGKDAARYHFLMRRSDSHLDFDLDLAKRQSNENPVYYVQYAHARICSILRTAEERGYAGERPEEGDLRRLRLPEEMALIKAVTRFPEVVASAAETLEPHRLTFYLNDLAGSFHSYYNKHRVMSDDRALTRARLFLVGAMQTVIGNALRLLGVTAPEVM